MSVRTLVDSVRQGAGKVAAGKSAVLAGDRALSYEDLLTGADGIASTLAKAGVRRGDRVGIWMEKTPACVQSLLGVMVAGAAYVPMDPRAPWRRCRTVVGDSGLAALVVDAAKLQYLTDLLDTESPRLVIVDGADPAELASRGDYPFVTLEQARQGSGPLPPAPTPEDLAYILYTSGSTGTPKGVAHTQRSGLAFSRWIQETFGIVAEDVFSSHAPLHFDLSISDLYASLGSGASVRLISATEAMLAPYLVKKVSEWGVTVWYSTPAILSSMLDVGSLETLGFGDVRILFFAGEVFPTPQLRRLRRALPRVGLYNLFGPTETNVCTYYEVPADLAAGDDSPIPIGRGCEHMETFVIDDQGQEVGVGTVGTLWVTGGNLMRGYWNDARRTAEMFRPDPRGGPDVACRTGDRVELQPDGNYRFLGRLDHMIKTRGYRVELGEIEHTLTSHPSVLDAIAVAIPDPKINNRIVATVVPRSGQTVEAGEVRAFCSERLPTYMIPEKIEVRDALPRTSTGKADRSRLRSEWQGKEQV